MRALEFGVTAQNCATIYSRSDFKNMELYIVNYADYIQVTISVILILSFAVASYQLVLMRKQMAYQYEWSRRQKALDYSLSRNKDLQQERKKLDELFGSVHRKECGIPLKTIEEKLSSEATAYTVITTLLAHWENLALAIECDVVDEEVAFEMTAGLVIDYVKTFHEFIEHRRKVNNPRAYKYLKDLAVRWEAELEGSNKITRTKFPRLKS